MKTGALVNGYEITEWLGDGAMGTVWKAEKQFIGTGGKPSADRFQVAIKFLLERWFTNERIVRRFFDEARAVIRIKHPGIVRIYDVGVHERSPFLIMEFLEGETLAKRIERRGRLPLGHLAEVCTQIASALVATHTAGIIHRDLKPENIFLVRDDEPRSRERAKLLDFGIAKLGSEAGKTIGDYPLGTPGYMSPELWRGAGHAGAAADVYAFGCIAFQLCCGQPPFAIQSIPEAYSKHVHELPPRVRSLAPEVTPEVDDVIARALAKDPIERPTARELYRFFSSLAAAPELADTAPRPPAPIVTPPPLGVPAPSVATPMATIPPPSTPRPGLRRSLVAAILSGTLVGIGGGRTPTWSSTNTPPLANAWVRVAAPQAPIVLGIQDQAAAASVLGFRAGRKVRSPALAFYLQEHEVSWSEIEPWLEATHTSLPVIAAWAKDAEARRSLPVTGVTWEIAERYCQSLGGDAHLPTVAQLELAARGAELRTNTWGNERLDPQRANAYRGAGAVPTPVEAPSQDRTPDQLFYGLETNVAEWTLGLWQPDRAEDDDSAATIGRTTTLRLIYGLPLEEDPPAAIQDEGAAYHERWCATGPCVRKTLAKLLYVGFRCARPAR